MKKSSDLELSAGSYRAKMHKKPVNLKSKTC